MYGVTKLETPVHARSLLFSNVGHGSHVDGYSLSLSKILFQSLKRKDMIVNSTKSQGLTLSLSIQTLPGRRREALYFIFSFMLFTQHFLTKQTLIF